MRKKKKKKPSNLGRSWGVVQKLISLVEKLESPIHRSRDFKLISRVIGVVLLLVNSAISSVSDMGLEVISAESGFLGLSDFCNLFTSYNDLSQSIKNRVHLQVFQTAQAWICTNEDVLQGSNSKSDHSDLESRQSCSGARQKLNWTPIPLRNNEFTLDFLSGLRHEFLCLDGEVDCNVVQSVKRWNGDSLLHQHVELGIRGSDSWGPSLLLFLGDLIMTKMLHHVRINRQVKGTPVWQPSRSSFAVVIYVYFVLICLICNMSFRVFKLVSDFKTQYFVLFLGRLRVGTAGRGFSSFLHQRKYSCASYHLHQSPSADLDNLFLKDDRPRRVLSSPTRDYHQSGLGVYFLRRVLCLPTRGDERCQGTAPKSFGLFLWIVRGGGLRTSAIYHSLERVGFYVIIAQLSVITKRDGLLISACLFLQPFVSAPLTRPSNHCHNHITGVRVIKVTPHPSRCGFLTLDSQEYSVAVMGRDIEQLVHLVLLNLQVLCEYKRIICPKYVTTSFY